MSVRRDEERELLITLLIQLCFQKKQDYNKYEGKSHWYSFGLKADTVPPSISQWTFST